MLANELGMIYKAKTNIITYVITWDGIVTNFNKHYNNQIGISPIIEAYIQSLVLKKTLEIVYLEFRRGFEDERDFSDIIQSAIERMLENKGSMEEGQVEK